MNCWNFPKSRFNTNSGSRFIVSTITESLPSCRITVNADGKCRWKDSLFIERWWKSRRDKDIDLMVYGFMADLEKGLEG